MAFCCCLGIGEALMGLVLLTSAGIALVVRKLRR
jgi:hypothetical protein